MAQMGNVKQYFGGGTNVSDHNTVTFNRTGREYSQVDIASNENIEQYLPFLSQMGVYAFSKEELQNAGCSASFAGFDGYVGDDLTNIVLKPNQGIPIQFLQVLYPGVVKAVTQPRGIDNVAGVVTQGDFATSQVAQRVLEPIGNSRPYQDNELTQVTNYNYNIITRDVVRFENGSQVGFLEQLMASKIQISPMNETRMAALESLEITRNAVGFFGYSASSTFSNTFGILNDPELFTYQTVALGGGGQTEWADKTYLEIVADINFFVQGLLDQSGGVVNLVEKDVSNRSTLLLSQAVIVNLNTISEFGRSVRQYINETYPGMRIISAPELDGADGGEDVAYLYVDKVNDGSTDGGNTIMQIVPVKLQSFSAVPVLKNSVKFAWANATAGVMVKRPYAVFRASGI
jgi:hypothetical protein